MSDTNARQEMEKFMQQSKETKEKYGLATPDTTQSSPKAVASQNQSMDNLAQMAQLAKLQDEMDALKAKNKHLESSLAVQKQASDDAKVENEVKAMNDIQKGFPEKFIKDYEFAVKDQNPLKLHIVIRPLTVKDISDMEQDKVRFTGGMNSYFEDDYQVITEAMSVFKIAGEEVPDWLKDPTMVFRTDIVTMIYRDYVVWLNSFRDHQTR